MYMVNKMKVGTTTAGRIAATAVCPVDEGVGDDVVDEGGVAVGRKDT